MSAFFTIDDQADEGVVLFGNVRPDIAEASAELFDFGMTHSMAVTGTPGFKPDMLRRVTSLMLLAFGFVDQVCPRFRPEGRHPTDRSDAGERIGQQDADPKPRVL